MSALFFRSDPRFLKVIGHQSTTQTVGCCVCVCLRIAKVLTVQVVIRNTYCSGGTSSNALARGGSLRPRLVKGTSEHTRTALC